MTRRGIQPSWIAWRVIEKAPVMIAWLAMIVAAVASSTRGTSINRGQSCEEDVVVSCWRHQGRFAVCPA